MYVYGYGIFPEERLGDISLPEDEHHIAMFFVVREQLEIPENGYEWPVEDYISIWHILYSPFNNNFD